MEKKNDILLSIIIPVYNTEKYLKSCIMSVLKPHRTDVEIIIVDDGSTDDSINICDYFSKYNNITVIHKENGGLSSARNTAIKIAKGKYLFFLDSDDMVTRHFYKRIIPNLKKDKYDIIEFKSIWKYSKKYIPVNDSNICKELSSQQYIQRIINNRIGCQICLRVYRRSLFKNVIFPEGRNYEDNAVIYKLIIKSKCNLLIDSELYIYNIANPNSITKENTVKNMYDMFLSVNEFYTGVKNNYTKEQINYENLEFFKVQSYVYIYFKLLQINDPKKEQLLNKICRYLDSRKISLCKYKNYDMKKLICYKMIKAFRKVFRYGDK